MILLCCKEINPNKQKNKLMSKGQLYDKKGKPKLQLKGRIFMQNVTDAISTSKPGACWILTILCFADVSQDRTLAKFSGRATPASKTLLFASQPKIRSENGFTK